MSILYNELEHRREMMPTWVRRNSASDDSGTLSPVDEEQSCCDSDGEGTSGEHCDCVDEFSSLEVEAGEL